MRFTTKGTTAVERVLANPVYAGMLKVQAYKEYPGGLFPAIHEPIIDTATWQIVQAKINKPQQTRSLLDEALPLRGILKCHCGNYLTGAPSRSKSGKYFYYYKCKVAKHNNVSAIKAHHQFLQVCELMSLPKAKVEEIKDASVRSISESLKSNKQKIIEKKAVLEETQEKMFSLEEKWIQNEISKDTYDRWHSNYNNTVINCKGAIERLSKVENRAYVILHKNLEMLTDLKQIYSEADLIQKREFVKLVFDSNLYYQEGTYRTPTMLSFLAHNGLKMKEKGLLEFKKKRDDFAIIPPSGVGENTFVKKIIV